MGSVRPTRQSAWKMCLHYGALGTLFLTIRGGQSVPQGMQETGKIKAPGRGSRPVEDTRK